ncbi:LPS biosynthesis glycosyltransferase [Phormidium tenue FACHB-886]|nr:LPS biosynthesis glycosyltransferase [Phormidium tenue FACHB-886]
MKSIDPTVKASKPNAPARTGTQSTSSRSLVDQIDRVLIVAYREATERLEAAFIEAGFVCEVLRQVDQPEYQDCAAIYRCLLNHHCAWQRAAAASKPTLIVEADFVPVVGLGKLPLPFAVEEPSVGMAWLYTCAAQLFSVSQAEFAEGFSTGLVAYVLTPEGAKGLLPFVEHITQAQGTGYYNFDSEIDQFLRQQGFRNYIPFRNYGEHGGKANPEHQHNGMSGIHRADVLFDRLAFLPAYALNSRWQFWTARLQARAKGLGRLLLGKYLRPKVALSSSVPDRLLRFTILRQLTLRL